MDLSEPISNDLDNRNAASIEMENNEIDVLDEDFEPEQVLAEDQDLTRIVDIDYIQLKMAVEDLTALGDSIRLTASIPSIKPTVFPEMLELAIDPGIPFICLSLQPYQLLARMSPSQCQKIYELLCAIGRPAAPSQTKAMTMFSMLVESAQPKVLVQPLLKKDIFLATSQAIECLLEADVTEVFLMTCSAKMPWRAYSSFILKSQRSYNGMIPRVVDFGFNFNTDCIPLLSLQPTPNTYFKGTTYGMLAYLPDSYAGSFKLVNPTPDPLHDPVIRVIAYQNLTHWTKTALPSSAIFEHMPATIKSLKSKYQGLKAALKWLKQNAAHIGGYRIEVRAFHTTLEDIHHDVKAMIGLMGIASELHIDITRHDVTFEAYFRQVEHMMAFVDTQNAFRGPNEKTPTPTQCMLYADLLNAFGLNTPRVEKWSGQRYVWKNLNLSYPNEEASYHPVAKPRVLSATAAKATNLANSQPALHGSSSHPLAANDLREGLAAAAEALAAAGDDSDAEEPDPVTDPVRDANLAMIKDQVHSTLNVRNNQ
jgi:hypothetical protein